MTVDNYTFDISSITQASPCVVTTSEAHGYSSGDFVRLTNFGLCGNSNFGMENLVNKEYTIVVTSTTAFELYELYNGEPIDSTTYTAYVSNGKVNKIRTLYQYT